MKIEFRWNDKYLKTIDGPVLEEADHMIGDIAYEHGVPEDEIEINYIHKEVKND